MSQSTEEKTWWVFFPLKGLDISDDNHDLLEPVFGDVTLVSKRHVKQIIPLLKFYKSKSKPKNNDGPTITYLVENIALKEDFHSFVAVRRTGIVNNEEPMPEIVSSARSRAYQFAALLALVFLAKSKSQETCGLVEQLRRHVRNFVMLSLEGEGGFRAQVAGGFPFTIRDSSEALTLSRSDLQLALREEPFRSLTEALLPQKSPLSKSLVRAISQSVVRFSDAVHSVTFSSQLLGAVIAIEILLASQLDKYDTLKQRLSILLGIKTIDQHLLAPVFQARHLYVHQGEEVNSPDISFKAVALALEAILQYAKMVAHFPSKEKLLEYLDFVYQGDNLSGIWTEKERQAFQELQRHERKSFELSFYSQPAPELSAEP